MSPIHNYFLGERLQSSASIFLALACIVLAFWLRLNNIADFYRVRKQGKIYWEFLKSI